ncbi:MAG: arylamine N-acetyltransferase [bacterium]|nr:arylamine N-acetyltransferase [bacterium]
MNPMRDPLFDRYLAVLGIGAEAPSFDHLERLVRAQLIRAPFENVSKLLQKRSDGPWTVPNLEEYLDGIERHNFGGTCYVNNPNFCQLLKHLGYEVDLCGADMSEPDVHVVSIVHFADCECLVDVGYGAPFYEPMPRDLTSDLEIRWGSSRYVLRPQDERGRSRMDHYHDDQLIHGYTVNPTARELDYFGDVIRDSYSDSATFMNTLVVERFYTAHSVRIHNLSIAESNRDRTGPKQANSRDNLADAVHREAGMPADLVREAIEGLTLEADIYS